MWDVAGKLPKDSGQDTIPGFRSQVEFHPTHFGGEFARHYRNIFFGGASSKKRAEAPNDEVLEMVIFHTWPQGSPLRAAEITGTPVFHPAI